MNILFIEDNSEISELKGGLLFRHKVTRSTTLFNARFCLEKDPGYAAFDAVILDLDMPRGDLPKEFHKEEKLPGYIFYERILKKYEKLYNNTIFLTGYAGKLAEQILKAEYDKLRIVNKDDNDTAKIIMELLNGMNIR